MSENENFNEAGNMAATYDMKDEHFDSADVVGDGGGGGGAQNSPPPTSSRRDGESSGGGGGGGESRGGGGGGGGDSSRNKRKYDDNYRSGNNGKRSRDRDDDGGGSDECYFKLMIPSAVAGGVIGRGGDKIGQIQKEASVRMKMSKNSEHYPNTNERVCLIIGSVKSVIKAHGMVVERMQEKDGM